MRKFPSIFVVSAALFLLSPLGRSEEVDVSIAISQMEEHIHSLGMTDAIVAQMNRKGRSDGELEMALRSARSSLAKCIVESIIGQAEEQGLPATPVLKLMSGIYQGPEDVEDASEIDVIKTFDFVAMERDKQSCYEQYMADVDTQVAPADE
ncbi:MAG: hypothetical protein WBN09_07555 [Woeseiaceae bacterium]